MIKIKWGIISDAMTPFEHKIYTPPIISPDHFVCTMGGVVFFVTILK
jgi:hypothetical protein